MPQNLRNLRQLFVLCTAKGQCLCTASQIIGGDFSKFGDLFRIYELYHSIKVHTQEASPLSLSGPFYDYLNRLNPIKTNEKL